MRVRVHRPVAVGVRPGEWSGWAPLRDGASTSGLVVVPLGRPGWLPARGRPTPLRLRCPYSPAPLLPPAPLPAPSAPASPGRHELISHVHAIIAEGAISGVVHLAGGGQGAGGCVGLGRESRQGAQVGRWAPAARPAAVCIPTLSSAPPPARRRCTAPQVVQPAQPTKGCAPLVTVMVGLSYVSRLFTLTLSK